ncbi:MAG: cyclic nucleotide-binding domain-containing protein, partial [Candidatus Competibacteraceae bacterium]|nr:cyclic nucleotide-binding domain-containing protein [Candidatus Competibacteraceae bacterium]
MHHRNEWRVLAEEELKLLAQSRKCRQYQAGEPIFSAGEPSHGIYCVTSGTVAIRKVDAEGNAVLVQLGYPGDTLGYRGLLLGEN